MELFDHEDIDGITEYVSEESKIGSTSLIVWDHSTISDVANRLLDLPNGTVNWPMDRYDVIWIINLDTGSLVQYCQHLLFGDLWCPVNPIQVHPVTNEFLQYISEEWKHIPMVP